MVRARGDGHLPTSTIKNARQWTVAAVANNLHQVNLNMNVFNFVMQLFVP